MKRTGWAVAVLLLLAGGAVADDNRPAIGHLRKVLGDKTGWKQAVFALNSTKDPDLLPLFVAMSRSRDKERRLLAASWLWGIGKDKAAPALIERIRKDPLAAVRSEALARLLNAKAMKVPDLLRVLDDGDENVRCLAAQGLLELGREAEAARELDKLVGSKEPTTVCMSRLALLQIGRTDQLGPLTSLLEAPDADPDVVALALKQITAEKLAAAAPLVRRLAAKGRSDLRLLAYRALAAVDTKAAEAIYTQIRQSDRIVYRMRLLSVLAEQKGAANHLAMIARGTDAVALVARFEQARPDGGRPAADALRAALRSKHPIVVVYLLGRARKDLKADRAAAAWYGPPLLQFVASAPRAGQMKRAHQRASTAATIVADLGGPKDLAGLRKLVSGPFDGVTRAAAAGMMHTENPAVCGLMRPLLKSPHGELISNAALVLGRFGDPQPRDYFLGVLKRPDRYSDALVTLSAWYVIKIDKRGPAAAAELAKGID